MKLQSCVLPVLFAVFLCGCATGGNALGRMSSEERAFAEKVHQVQPGMTKEQVVEILGPEYRERSWMLIWEPTGSSANQVGVQFIKGTVHDVQWIKVGSGAFVYEPLNDR